MIRDLKVIVLHCLMILLWSNNWFMQENSCKILSLIVSTRPRTENHVLSNGEVSYSNKKKSTPIDDVLKDLIEWLCAQDLLEALNQLEGGLKDNIRRLSSFDKYKQEVLLGHLDWSPKHKDPNFWRENITNFEENDIQIVRVLITILDTSNDPTALAVACYDISQFIQYHPAGRIILSDLKAKERVMKLMNHENAEVTKNALLCVQRLFLSAKYASFMQA